MIPRIAIIDQNTLEATGLKGIICDIVPMADVTTFFSFEEMMQERAMSDEEAPFYHFFVSSQILVLHADFFRMEVPILNRQFEHFHTLNTAQLEHDMLKSILTLFHHGHGKGHANTSSPTLTEREARVPLSQRETEVLALVVRGFINKEIADRLCISLPTVVSHRKNICDKLRLRSVSSLTIYAVTHGLVNAEEI